ncbi:alpha/beta hydrolase family protein [Bradyrhizobium monzae]|uniref:alpha/beta hydrolase family protein n=1 Tax=Bradyrhizobium sp. Oc8 TaxID=2876780 RepID=UPI001F4487F1|nr:prolyl oligopeptidase family serine peptidase [Bradyrhizobium sp. Oc8]
MRRPHWFCLALFFGLASSAHAAGLQLLDTDPTLAGAIWYPCAADPQEVALGKVSMNFITTLQGVKDCPVSGSRLPVVIIAHGRGGWFGGHDDTAQALADAGFVVAAINYRGDNGADRSQSESLYNITARPADTIRLLNFMLNDWRDRAVIDPERIGFFGFSAGAYTGLILAGAKPDYQKIAGLCTESNNSLGCEQFRRGDIPPEPAHEPRIRAAVLADTALNFMFSPEGLTGVHIPLLIWRSKSGGGGVDPQNAALTASSLPGKPEVRVVPAGHFAFLAPCTAKFAAEIPRLCTDPPGFDRAAFHRELNASIVSFLRDHLAAEGDNR